MVIGAVNQLSNQMSGMFKQLGTKAGGTEASANPESPKVKGTDIKQTAEKILEKFLNAGNNTAASASKPTAEDFKTKLADLQHKGRMMRHHPIPSMVGEYIQGMQSMLTEMKDHAHEGFFKDDAFQHIEIVDEKLDQLATEFVEGQKAELELVASLGELEGLLIDVFV